MSSWKKASKTNQKSHRERHQPASRAHLGLLEKKKDYKLRAADHQEKHATIKLLRKRALNKNPDEFYFHMINSKVEDGVHQEKDEDEHTPEQIRLMQSQDLRYVVTRRTMEIKKIERLQSQLHFLEAANKTTNTHTFFVDSKEDKKNFDVAKRLDTHPALLDRRINRPRLSDLEKLNIEELSVEQSKISRHEKKKLYVELAKRVEREKQLGIIQRKLELKKHLSASTIQKPERVKGGTKDLAPVYKWAYERKR